MQNKMALLVSNIEVLLKLSDGALFQYNNLFAFPCEIRLQEIYIHIFFFYDKMLSNFEICI